MAAVYYALMVLALLAVPGLNKPRAAGGDRGEIGVIQALYVVVLVLAAIVLWRMVVGG